MDNLENRRNIKLGDPVAFTSLYKATYPRMLGYCSLFIKDTKQSEDLVQDCYENIWTNKEKINPAKSLESFLFVMLRNKCLNALKKDKIYQSISLTEDLPINELQFLYHLDFTHEEGISMEEELIIAMQKAINELPEKRKNVFIACKVNGRKQKEVAEEFGITIKAVEKHLSKSKDQLRKILMKDYAQLSFFILMLLH